MTSRMQRAKKRQKDAEFRPLVGVCGIEVTFSESTYAVRLLGLRKQWESKGEAMTALVAYASWGNSTGRPEPRLWYALATLSRHEWLVSKQLHGHGMEPFVPTKVEIHRWSDRRKKVEMPLFPGYVFLHANMCIAVRHTVQGLRGCAGFITMQGEPVSIPDEQITGIKKVLEQRISCNTYSYLRAGHRVRVRGGCLDGIEGVLVRTNGEKSLVMSIDGIARSLVVRIEDYAIEQL